MGNTFGNLFRITTWGESHGGGVGVVIDGCPPRLPLTEADIQTLVVNDKWLATLAAAVQGELDRVSQTLTGRIRQLAERYATPLPQLTDEVATLAARVDGHLKKMGAVWK
jgi:hypothetical protein